MWPETLQVINMNSTKRSFQAVSSDGCMVGIKADWRFVPSARYSESLPGESMYMSQSHLAMTVICQTMKLSYRLNHLRVLAV